MDGFPGIKHPAWGVFTDGVSPSEERTFQEKAFKKANCAPASSLTAIEHQDGKLTGIVFTNNEVLPRRGILLRPQPYQHSNLAAKLGCKFGSNDIVEVDESKQTSISGLYAVGDVSSPCSQIALAVTSGTIAAAFINRTLVQTNANFSNRGSKRCLNSQQISRTMLANAADEMVLAYLQAYLPERAKSGYKFFCNTTNLRVALGQIDKSNAENKICDR